MMSESRIFNPTDLQTSRSTFKLSPTVSGTMNAGRLIPVKTLFVQPGDSISMNLRSLVKMSTPVYPTADPLYLDVFFFFVPFTFILSRRYGTPSVNDGSQSWKAIVGAQDNAINMPIPASGLRVPTFHTEATDYEPGALLDYFPIDYKSENDYKLSCLPLLSYFAIYNENFRDPNLFSPVTWSFNNDGSGGIFLTPYGDVPLYATKAEASEVSRTGASGLTDDYVLLNAIGGDCTAASNAVTDAGKWLPFPVCTFHGYFGSALPWPQRNATGVELPLGDKASLVFPSADTAGRLPLYWRNQSGPATDANQVLTPYTTLAVQPGAVGAVSGTDGSDNSGQFFTSIVNSYADLSSATAANVNALRAAIQQQRWYEKLARSGNRYDELEYGLFGVRPHDSGDDRPKYLGGKRIPLSIEMVASTNGGANASEAEGGGSLGSLGAFSHTVDGDHYFYQSFDDWGVVMCVACVRHHITLGSGTDRFWKKLTRDDLYFPTFAHLGEQAVNDDELVDKADDGTVFGYVPAWDEYRVDLDRVHGLLRPGKSLDFMTYSRSYESGTTLKAYLNASRQVATVDKTLAVGSNASGFQFVYQFNFDYKIRRAMPVDSIPGLMDHF